MITVLMEFFIALLPAKAQAAVDFITIVCVLLIVVLIGIFVVF